MGLVNKTFCRQEVRDCQFETLQIRSEFKKSFIDKKPWKLQNGIDQQTFADKKILVWNLENGVSQQNEICIRNIENGVRQQNILLTRNYLKSWKWAQSQQNALQIRNY